LNGNHTSILITTTHHVLAYSDNAGFRIVHTGKGLYYGLSQHDARIYISCRNRTEGPVDATVRAAEQGSVLVLNADTLEPVDELLPSYFPLRDVHGIAIVDQKLWVTCSFDNMIAVYDLGTGKWGQWYPAPDSTSRNRDVNHFNTIAMDVESGQLQLLAHNNGPSELYSFHLPTCKLESIRGLGFQAHDIFSWQGSVATCSSGEGVLTNTAGWKLRTGGFPRGITHTQYSVWLGISDVVNRTDRHRATSIVRRYTRDWRSPVDYVLPQVGMVLGVLEFNGRPEVLQQLPAFEYSEELAPCRVHTERAIAVSCGR
jgi:hypothetical protein